MELYRLILQNGVGTLKKIEFDKYEEFERKSENLDNKLFHIKTILKQPIIDKEIHDLEFKLFKIHWEFNNFGILNENLINY